MKTNHTFIHKLASLIIILAGSAFFADANDGIKAESVYIDEAVEDISELLKEDMLEDGVFHLFAHGKSGKLYINEQWLSSQEIIEFLKPLVLDDAGASKFSHLNVYACDFGKGEKGISAMKNLHSFFDGGIAASNNKVGNESYNADWEMEIVMGDSKNILQFPEWNNTLQITFSYTGNYSNTATYANFNCPGFTIMDATLVLNNNPLTITFSCPVTAISIPVVSLGDSNVETYSFDAVGSPETLTSACPDVNIVGNTVVNTTGSAGTSGVELYVDLTSTVPFTQIIVSKISGSFAAGVLNTGTGYWIDPCATNPPCTTPDPCNISGPATITTGGMGSFSTAVPFPVGTSSSWSISPTTGVSSTSGTGNAASNITFATAGTYTVTFTHTNNSVPSACTPSDSISCTTSVVVNSLCTTINDSSTVTTCDSAQINSNWYYSSQLVQDTFPNGASNGCDSIHSTNLTINYSSSFTDVQVACDIYTWSNGISYTTSNTTATQTLVNADGCDSVLTLNLTINNSDTSTDVQVACDSLLWIDGITYFANNNTASVTLTNAYSCDSVVNLDLTINNSSSSTDVVTACNSFTWLDGNSYVSNNNSATHTISNSNGCDSVITLNLSIIVPDTTADFRFACETFDWIDGITYTASNNTALHTITGGASNGCDSIVALNLIVLQNSYGFDTITACDSIEINTNWYYSSQIVIDTFLSNASCDSISTTSVIIETSTTRTDIVTACDSFTWINGVTYTTSNNSALHAIPSSSSCDTIVSLNLSINNSSSTNDVITACNSYTWIDGVTYTSDNNTATQTLISSNGCDSIVNLNLSIGTPDTTIDARFACDSLTWIDGITYTASNFSAVHTIPGGSSDGCDSIVALNLQMLFTSYGNDTLRACDSVELNSNWYSVSQTVTDTIVSNANCDLILTTYIIIESSTAIPVISIDTVLCIGEVLILNAEDYYGNDYTYQWEGNTTDPIFQTTVSGPYSLSVIDSNLCTHERQAMATFEDCSEACQVIAPTGFSPNEDGSNDVFKIFRVCELDFTSWEVKVYNRWGELIFKSNDFLDNWDGTYNSKKAAIGVYSYTIEYTIEGSTNSELVKGAVTLIR